MPNRIIRDGILTSDRVNELSIPAELFYRRLMSVVDDYGRFDARPVMLKVCCFPLRVDVVREADISRWIAECEKAGLIVLYAVDGKPYGEYRDFRQAIRAKQSKYPCIADATQMPRIRIADAPVVEVECEDEGVARKPARKTPIPVGFAISDRVKAWALAKGHSGTLQARFEHFVGTCKAKGYQYLDWDEAFMNAIRKDWAALDGQDKPTTAARVAL